MQRSTQIIDSREDSNPSEKHNFRPPKIEDADECDSHAELDSNTTTALPSRSQNTPTKMSPSSGQTKELPTARHCEYSPSTLRSDASWATTDNFGTPGRIATTTNAFRPPGGPNLGTGLFGPSIRDPPSSGTALFGSTIRDPSNSSTGLFGSTIRRDSPALASHYSFNSQDDQYRMLLDSSKIAKETIKLLQEPITTFGFLRPSEMAEGYIAIICFTLHPNLLMIIPSTDSPSVDLPLPCKILQANSETARVTWIKTKHVHRVKKLAHLELLQNFRKSLCMQCSFASHSDSAWYDVGLQEGLRVVNQWVEWMDQSPFLPTGHLKLELHKKASAAIELINQHDKESPKQEWLKDFMMSRPSATSASTQEEARCTPQ